MIHLGDRQDIFLLMLTVSLQPICCVSACVSRSQPPGSFSSFIFAMVFVSQGCLCEEKVTALSNEASRPVTGTNYCTVVAEHSGEGGQKGRASGHY